METKSLQLRMYFFVPFNLSPIQQSIQAGHASLEYAYTYGNKELFQNFVKYHKTWIILNGGTTNNSENNPVSLQLILQEILDFNSDNFNKVEYSTFYEPDLNDALTAICFIADERTFNNKDYPSLKTFAIANVNMPITLDESDFDITEEEIKISFPDIYEEWLDLIGGKRNEFLRQLLKNKKLA